MWTGRTGFAVQEFARRHGDFAIAGATVAVELDGDDRIRRCAVGLIGLGSTPVRATAAEGAAAGRAVAEVPADELGQQAMAGLDEVPSDLQGSASLPHARRCRDGVAGVDGQRSRRPGMGDVEVRLVANGQRATPRRSSPG